jgi:hypothetical protein
MMVEDPELLRDLQWMIPLANSEVLLEHGLASRWAIHDAGDCTRTLRDIVGAFESEKR